MNAEQAQTEVRSPLEAPWPMRQVALTVGENAALRRIVKWACDAEDVDFFVRDHPADVAAITLIRQIVLGIDPPQ